jgi:cytochrome b subunit of formate dehydrogenase
MQIRMFHSLNRLVPATILAALFLIPSSALAQEVNCLMCHQNPAFFQSQENGERLVVTQESLSGSVHGSLRCQDCHAGLEFPHQVDAPAPNCGQCHGRQTRQHTQSLHGQAASRGDALAPGCQDCHGSHDILSSRNLASQTSVMNIPALCGECHQEGTEVSERRDIPQDSILYNYSLSIHGAGLFERGLSVTAVCTSCHTSHFILPHEDPRSSIHLNSVAGTCMACHSRIEEVHTQVIEGRLWEEQPHMIPACVDCHQPHEIRRVFYDAGVANADCLECHSDPELTGTDFEGDTVSMFVDEGPFSAGEHRGTTCAQCHTDVSVGFDERPCETVSSPVDCAICHAGPVQQFQASTHGRLAAEGVADAPVCLDCHDRHATADQTNPTSPTYPRNVPELCGTCHQEGEAAARRIQREGPDIVRGFEMSIHGKGLLQSGLVVTATCTDCHGAHTEAPAADSASMIHPNNVAATCGQCHHGIEEEFRESIHYPENGDYSAEGDHQYPTCEDCHTSHTISRTDRDDFRMLMMSQCGRCHEDESETFFETYHGKVSRLGGARAAKCYDCHGTHNVLPNVEPASMLSRENIVDTCAQCHPAANEKFTGYLTHATHHDPDKYPWLFWSFWAMTGLLVSVLTFSLIHTGAWLFRLWREPEHWKGHVEAVGEERKQLYRRFTQFQRIMHLVMLLSFMLLAATGMALKFSWMGWAKLFSRMVGGFEAMGVLHRLGAVALIAIFVVHLWDVRKQKHAAGKTWKEYIFSRDSLMFNKNDGRELVASIKWFFGKGDRPDYGRFTYWEKFDYFAVFWGMFIIGSTGLFLWFPEFFTNVLPGWFVNVATIIHSDEALLAVAFIFTIHFFNTHFRLDKFPMDPVIFTGRVPLEELKRDKPKEYERMKAEGKLQERLVEPLPKEFETTVRVFGFTMLAIGLTIVGLILYTMLFGYR